MSVYVYVLFDNLTAKKNNTLPSSSATRKIERNPTATTRNNKRRTASLCRSNNNKPTVLLAHHHRHRSSSLPSSSSSCLSGHSPLPSPSERRERHQSPKYNTGKRERAKVFFVFVVPRLCGVCCCYCNCFLCIFGCPTKEVLLSIIRVLSEIVFGILQTKTVVVCGFPLMFV